MTKFGWCMDGFHQGSAPKEATECPGRSGSLTCSCTCHQQSKFPRKKTQ